MGRDGSEVYLTPVAGVGVKLMMRVLVIDDDVEFTEHLKAVKPVEVSMDVVHDSESVFAHLRAGIPDVIVLDLSMAPTLATEMASEGRCLMRRGRLWGEGCEGTVLPDFGAAFRRRRILGCLSRKLRET